MRNIKECYILPLNGQAEVEKEMERYFDALKTYVEEQDSPQPCLASATGCLIFLKLWLIYVASRLNSCAFACYTLFSVRCVFQGQICLRLQVKVGNRIEKRK